MGFIRSLPAIFQASLPPEERTDTQTKPAALALKTRLKNAITNYEKYDEASRAEVFEKMTTAVLELTFHYRGDARPHEWNPLVELRTEVVRNVQESLSNRGFRLKTQLEASRGCRDASGTRYGPNDASSPGSREGYGPYDLHIAVGSEHAMDMLTVLVYGVKLHAVHNEHVIISVLGRLLATIACVNEEADDRARASGYQAGDDWFEPMAVSIVTALSELQMAMLTLSMMLTKMTRLVLTMTMGRQRRRRQARHEKKRRLPEYATG